MKPLFKEGDFVVAESMSYLFLKPRVGQVAVVKHPTGGNMLLLKRIVKERQGLYWLKGDNSLASTDSRDFGWLNRDCIVGRVAMRVGNPTPEQSLVRDCARQGKFGSLELSTRQALLSVV